MGGGADTRHSASLQPYQGSGWPTRAAARPISGVSSEKIEANQPGLVTIDGGKALQPSFISCQVPSWQYFTVSLVTMFCATSVSAGMSPPSSF